MRQTLSLLLMAGLIAGAAVAQSKKQKEEEARLRVVQGTVVDEQEKPVSGAVVQIKDSKTLKVRSFITREDGSYQFHGLDPNVDYALKADHQDRTSDSRILSSFDNRKKPVMNLKLDKKKGS